MVKKRGLDLDLAKVEAVELAKQLRKFYAEVKTKEGQMMSPSGLRGLRAAIHRTLTSPPMARDIIIITDTAFRQANKMIEAMYKQYVSKANPKPKHHPAKENGDLKKIANYLSQYKSSPEILLHCFWFLVCYNFARRGCEGWRDLTRNSFGVATDDEGKRYMYLRHTEKNKNWQGGSSSKAWDYSDIRAYGINVEGVNLNIVEVYEFYLSKLHPECPALLQKPKYKKWSEAEHSVWFDNVPVGVNKINEKMKRISECAHLSATYTNHTVRATAITVMNQGGVDTKQICKITKHKAEESLKHYIDGQSTDQKRRCSEVLSSVFQNSTCSSVRPAGISQAQNKNLLSSRGVVTPKVNPSSPGNRIVSQSVYSLHQSFAFPFRRPQSFNINVSGGNCHFHYDGHKMPPVAEDK